MRITITAVQDDIRGDEHRQSMTFMRVEVERFKPGVLESIIKQLNIAVATSVRNANKKKLTV